VNTTLFFLNHDIYLRDYIINIFLFNDNMYSQLENIVYTIFIILNVKILFVKATSLIINSVYTSNVYSYFATPIIEVMYNVQREYYIIMTAMLVLILYIIIRSILSFRNIDYRYSVLNSFVLELAWSILPAVIILHFMMMSISLLYVSDEHPFFGFHVKVIGHQWYWEYEIIRCFNNIESVYTNMFDSIIPDTNLYIDINNSKIFNDLNSVTDLKALKISSAASRHILDTNSAIGVNFNSNFIKFEAERLLDTEGILYVPYRIHVRLLITSMDVIHAFAIPSLGIKADAIPGRLNDLHFFLTDNSAMTHYFGQCSELCGVGHAFMPIHMVSI
jgi:heme/copper-type cytochrome/quinol oxidase subunit 2